MKVRIEIDTMTFVRFWVVVIGFALVALLVYGARQGLILLGTALFLALALNGPVSRLARHLPGKSRVGSTAIAYFVVVILLGAFLFLAVPPIVQQTAKFAQTVPALVDNATRSWHSVNDVINQYHLRPQVDQAISSLKDNATHWASNVGTIALDGVGSFFNFLTSLLLVLVLSFLMLVEGPAWMERFWGLYTDSRRRDRHHKTLSQMANIVAGFVTGQLTVSALDGLFAGLAVFVISLFSPIIPSSLALATAAIMFVMSLIPLFGAMVGAVIVCLLLGFNSVGAAVAFAIYFFVYQQLENNFISPTIQSRKLELSPLLVLAAVTVGIYMFGIAGAIISIPIAGCAKVLLEEYLARARDERTENTKKHPIHKFVGKLKDET